MITIDGSFGEGGGQILRTSLSLAAITGQEVTIENIRAGRDKPGLRPQHLTAVLAVAEICGAEVQGAEVGSSKLVFRPRRVKSGRYEFDVARIRSSAGSVNLVFQTVLWPLAFAERTSLVTIKGGTHVPFAPTSNYIEETFLPTIVRMGVPVFYRMKKAGYYPAGGGEIRAEIPHVDEIAPVLLAKRKALVSVELISAVSNLPMNIAERQMNTGIERLRAIGIEPATEIVEYPSSGKGAVFFISCAADNVHAGFQSLGELHKRAEQVAKDACDEFERYLSTNAALDKHLADQLIIPMALSEANSVFTTCEVTQHLITNIDVVEKFLPVSFRVIGNLGEPGRVERKS